MGTKLNNRGFSAVEALLIVLIVLILGFGGYYVWSKAHNKPVNTNSSKTVTSNNENCSNNGGKLSIASWVISITTIPSELGNVCYKLSNDNSLLFISDLQKSTESCLKSESYGPWGIYRFTSSSADEREKFAINNGTALNIGNYYYLKSYPQVGCSDNQSDTVNNLYKSLDKDTDIMLNSIK